VLGLIRWRVTRFCADVTNGRPPGTALGASLQTPRGTPSDLADLRMPRWRFHRATARHTDFDKSRMSRGVEARGSIGTLASRVPSISSEEQRKDGCRRSWRLNKIRAMARGWLIGCLKSESAAQKIAPSSSRRGRDRSSVDAQIFNEWLLFCGGDVASQSNCCRKRQYAPLSESNAHHCDTCATPRMSRAHGTYVASSMANTAKRAYVYFNNDKKRETPWSRLT
jgi:hypothetical protein